MGWQPIETAKKGGDEVLIFSERGMFVAWFDDQWSDGGWWMISDGRNEWYPLRGSAPTHWTPLPEPPK
jgi:hypothetical protein